MYCFSNPDMVMPPKPLEKQRAMAFYNIDFSLQNQVITNCFKKHAVNEQIIGVLYFYQLPIINYLIVWYYIPSIQLQIVASYCGPAIGFLYLIDRHTI